MSRKERRAAAKNGGPRSIEDAIQKISDPQCVACYITNESAVPLTFVSVLEHHYPMLIEAKAFVKFELQPEEKRLVPHSYFDILPYDAERKINVAAIPKDHPPVEFLYSKRETPKEKSKTDVDFSASEKPQGSEANG